MSNLPNESPLSHDADTSDLLLTTKAPRVRRDVITPPAESDTPEAPTVILAPRDSHHRHHHEEPKKKKRKWPLILLIIGIVLLCLAVTAVSVFAALRSRGQSELLPQEPVELLIPEAITDNPDIEVQDNGRTVMYNGARYQFNETRTNILCIGIDKEAMGLDDEIVGTGGQADVLMLLSVDTATGELDALAISRDTITPITVHASDGSFHSLEETQLCLAYAYGDGKETSCQNTVNAVSRLLYSIPVNTYFAMDLSSISVANDAIGGVEVTLLKDLRRNDGTITPKGQTVTLFGDEAERYVRDRDVTLLDSNLDRMERQKQYLTAFFSKALAATTQDLQVPLRLLEAVSSNSVTNLNASKITFLSTALVKHRSDLMFSSVAGEVVKGEDGYAEYHVDQQALYEQVLDIFFTKVS